MNGSHMHWPVIRVATAALLLSSCASSGGKPWVELTPQGPSTGPTFRITGTVRHLELEGGLFVIRDAAGTQYNPLNLPQDFRVDGIPVEADARRSENVASIGMVGPMVEIVRIRRSGDEVPSAELWGTVWRLEDLAGAGVMDRVQATLEFPEKGRASGSATCNQFHGTVTISGSTITFGPLATTRKTCGEAVMHQENEYLAALREAERFETKDSFLYIYATGRPAPLRFVAAD